MSRMIKVFGVVVRFVNYWGWKDWFATFYLWPTVCVQRGYDEYTRVYLGWLCWMIQLGGDE